VDEDADSDADQAMDGQDKEVKKKKKKKKKKRGKEEGGNKKESKKSKRKKRKHPEEKSDDDSEDSPRKKRKIMPSKAEEDVDNEGEFDPMAVLKGMTDMMTGEAMVKPAISPYGHVMEYDSWCSILRNPKTKNKCPFTQQKITRRQLVRLDADNIEEYRDKIVNVAEQMMSSEV